LLAPPPLLLLLLVVPPDALHAPESLMPSLTQSRVASITDCMLPATLLLAS
jgi:hypothetical protein